MSISTEERQRRQAAADNARGSLRLEGLYVSPEAESIVARFINGEISEDAVTALLLALHRRKPA